MGEQISPLSPSDQCPQIQLMGFMYCGCSTGPKSVNESCAMCPEGYKIKKDQPIADLEGNFTCGDFVDPFGGLPKLSQICNDAKQGAFDSGCCEDSFTSTLSSVPNTMTPSDSTNSVSDTHTTIPSSTSIRPSVSSTYISMPTSTPSSTPTTTKYGKDRRKKAFRRQNRGIKRSKPNYLRQ